MWRLEFDAERAEGGCYVLTNHPFLTGRPSRAEALDDLISYVCSHDDIWVTHGGHRSARPRARPRPAQR